MIASLKRRNISRDRLLSGLGILALAIAITMIIRSYVNSTPSSVTISAGNIEGVRHRLLLSLGRQSGWSRFRILPVETSGTIEMLEKIQSGKLDFGLIQGGFDMSKYPEIRQVAGLGVEPLHLLVKEELREAVALDMRSLKKRTIDMGSDEDSETYWLSREVLKFVGLSPDDYVATHQLDQDSAKQSAESQPSPDAVFVASPVPSVRVEELVKNGGYRLVPMPFGEAFRLRALGVWNEHEDGRISVRKENIQDATIPKYAYQASPPVPDQPVTTLGTKVLVVCHRKANETAVTRILEAILASPRIKAAHPNLGVSVIQDPPEIPWHDGVLAFRRRTESFATSEKLAEMANTFTIAVPLFGAIFLFWKRFRTRLRADRDWNLDRLMDRVSMIEKRALDLTLHSPGATEILLDLLKDLAECKLLALNRFTSDEVEETVRLTNFLAHVRDVRTILNHLQLLVWEISRSEAASGPPKHSAPETSR